MRNKFDRTWWETGCRSWVEHEWDLSHEVMKSILSRLLCSLLGSHSFQHRYSSAPPNTCPCRLFSFQSQLRINGDPGKFFLLHLSTLLCLSLELFVFAEWTWPSVIVTQLWKRDAFIFSPCHFVLPGWHLKEEKRQKATTNSIGDEKGEAKLPFLTHFCNEPHKRPHKMRGNISADTHPAVYTHCVPHRAILTVKCFSSFP